MSPSQSAATQADEHLVHLTRQLEMMTAVQERTLRARDERELFRETCRLMVDVGGYRLAWLGLREPPPEADVEPVAQAGDTGYLEALHVSWADDETGRGPPGWALRMGEPQVVRDIHKDPDFAPWREEARQHGYASVAALPLRVEGRVIGALTVYSGRRDAFDEEELALLEQLMDNLGSGVENLAGRRARERAEQRSLELGEAVERAKWGVAFSNSDRTRLARVNTAFARMHGVERPEDYEGVPVMDLFPAEERERARRHLEQADQTGHVTFKTEHVRLDGSRFPVLMDVSVPPNAGHGGRIVHIQDLTEHERVRAERRRAREREREVRRLREVDAQRTRIMSEVAHELKNPLTPLRIRLKLLRDAVGDERVLRNLDVLERNVDRVTALTEDLLEASRLGDGRLPLRITDVDLSKRLRETVSGYTDIARRGDLELTADVPEGLRVLADPGRLDQVLLNLLSNARKYTPPGGSILVRARREGDRVRVEVSDTGVGIPAGDADRLFEPFERGAPPPREEDTSTGLGLYITQGLVALQDGRMGAESEGPGKGSTFWFTVPAA